MNRTSVYRLLLVLSVILNIGLLVAVLFMALWDRPPGSQPCHDDNSADDLLGGIICHDLETQPGNGEEALGKDDISNVSSAQKSKPYENIFEDLTREEIQAVLDYMYSVKDLDLVTPDLATLTDNYIMSVELHLPNKSEAMTFLAGQGPRPTRQARVVTLEPRADHATGRTILQVSYRLRQGSSTELRGTVELLLRYMKPRVEKVLKHVLGASFVDCGTRCLTFTAAPLSTAFSETRSLWIAALHQVDFPTLYPVSLQLLLHVDGPDVNTWRVAKVWFANQTFPSLDDIVDRYNEGMLPNGTSPTHAQPKGDKLTLGNLSLREAPVPRKPQAGPRQYQPQGNRFNMQGQRVTYLQWEFSWRMSAATGIQLLDVRHVGQRVLYELSLQEVAVLYSGANPLSAFSQFVDSAFGLGNRAHGLMPGVDCPDYAVFLDTVLYTEDFMEPHTYPKVVCIFEHNTQKPLRRHKSNSFRSGFFYGGMLDTVLVLRTCLTLFNYDYLVDFVFHSNGVMEVSVSASGYILASYYTKDEDVFGFRLGDTMLGGLHRHLLHFKVDLDVVGVVNRYKTLDLYVDNRTWPWSERKPHYQTAMRKTLLHTEKDAALRQDDSTPRYHVIYNQHHLNQQGNLRGYRLVNRSPIHQLLPEWYGAERSLSWSRYPIAVTRRKETEETSSSRHAQFDSSEPVVDFKSFIEDNENIVDEDLVAWLTLGVYHIPHGEDLPNVATAAKDMTFALLPFNNFDEDPSMVFRDAVRVDAVLEGSQKGTLRIDRNGIPAQFQCVPRQYDFDAFENSTDSLFFGLD
ncbi:hypothetical protein BaRGS_00019478 [Batillaria attramentaria]|uniref:Amine oxidase n=1 Tax=Batillaria attramentaria TaxID=370345 RepID=A0ABD0KQ95_9CAEN